MKDNLKNKKILVVGATSGIGRQLAFDLVEAGSAVVLTSTKLVGNIGFVHAFAQQQQMCRAVVAVLDEVVGKAAEGQRMLRNTGTKLVIQFFFKEPEM